MHCIVLHYLFLHVHFFIAFKKRKKILNFFSTICLVEDFSTNIPLTTTYPKPKRQSRFFCFFKPTYCLPSNFYYLSFFLGDTINNLDILTQCVFIYQNAMETLFP